ncbi:MAG: adenylyltransferase/cytidyltransferase family protein, partial [Planctomycetota bacterium]|nr:adenylyltransferase/cytidyltransferase family protein [Planctomycetota bacterium]
MVPPAPADSTLRPWRRQRAPARGLPSPGREAPWVAMSAPEPAKIIRDHAALSRVVEEHRAAGRRVVFTNGTFDLLHVGHLRSLTDARSRGDLLIVALNSDAS